MISLIIFIVSLLLIGSGISDVLDGYSSMGSIKLIFGVVLFIAFVILMVKHDKKSNKHDSEKINAENLMKNEDFENVKTETKVIKNSFTTTKTYVNGKEVSNDSEEMDEEIENILNNVNETIANAFGKTTKKEQTFIECEYCGTENNENAKFCSSCGASLKRKK